MSDSSLLEHPRPAVLPHFLPAVMPAERSAWYPGMHQPLVVLPRSLLVSLLAVLVLPGLMLLVLVEVLGRRRMSVTRPVVSRSAGMSSV